MNKKETLQILTLLSANYESFAKRTEIYENLQIVANLWYECLKDLEYNLVLLAVKQVVISNKFPPTINEIREKVVEIINPKTDSAIEAWEEAYKMICNGSYMTKEEFESHSPKVKKFFGSVEQVRQLGKVDIDTCNTVVKGQFLKQYQNLSEREEKERLLPKEMNEMIDKLTSKMDIGELGEGGKEL